MPINHINNINYICGIKQKPVVTKASPTTAAIYTETLVGPITNVFFFVEMLQQLSLPLSNHRQQQSDIKRNQRVRQRKNHQKEIITT